MRDSRRTDPDHEAADPVEYGFSVLPEVAQCGNVKTRITTIPCVQSEKEVSATDEKETVEDFAYGLPFYPDREYHSKQHVTSESNVRGITSKDKFGQQWRLCGVILAIFIALAIALGAGLGYGLLHQRAKSNDQHGTGASSATQTSSNLSTRGAYNGTGIAIIRDSNGQNLTSSIPGSYDKRNLLLVFQHFTGQLRWMQRLQPSGSWVGGSAYEVVATDARNGTPISVNVKQSGLVAYHHVFYIDKNNKVRQRSIDSNTLVWADGPVSNLDIQALSSEKSGLMSCYYGGPVANANSAAATSNDGIQLWVAASETRFDMWAWQPGLPWVFQQSLSDLNGHANPACNAWEGVPNTTYTMFVDLHNAINVYWMDAYAETNKWTNSSVNIPDIDPGIGIAYQGNLFARAADTGLLMNWNVSFAVENAAIASNAFPAFNGVSPVNGSDMALWAHPAGSDATEAAIFYQAQGDDITMYATSSSSGSWVSSVVPIPDD